jgi:hypothetical protein
MLCGAHLQVTEAIDFQLSQIQGQDLLNVELDGKIVQMATHHRKKKSCSIARDHCVLSLANLPEVCKGINALGKQYKNCFEGRSSTAVHSACYRIFPAEAVPAWRRSLMAETIGSDAREEV